ncbi:hypothetical protein SAMN04488025_101115 [Planifilum fulgidum]|uniref:Uncharacterized protein n=1 Tax=Planifilum fulgidum TaxID=201973 RepID=A0A1I2KAG4_9BACL|nr:hypothetical protein [Planifilum fulgidum]MBO2495209.1 hypothetical protein [Bacillota bacterium]MBO2532678.1 hypothetical protein [Thermoactinomycetaceae bacterium]SFF64045.1 hypothetical protein SAMN04488025_101115 [Planifilum fulgidum]
MARKNLIVVHCGHRRRRRRRLSLERVEAEVENFARTGAISGTANVVTQTPINLGDAAAIGRGNGNSVTNLG